MKINVDLIKTKFHEILKIISKKFKKVLKILVEIFLIIFYFLFFIFYFLFFIENFVELFFYQPRFLNLYFLYFCEFATKLNPENVNHFANEQSRENANAEHNSLNLRYLFCPALAKSPPFAKIFFRIYLLKQIILAVKILANPTILYNDFCKLFATMDKNFALKRTKLQNFWFHK